MDLKHIFYPRIANKMMSSRRRNSRSATTSSETCSSESSFEGDLKDCSYNVANSDTRTFFKINMKNKQLMGPRKKPVRFPEDVGRPMSQLSKCDAEYFSRRWIWQLRQHFYSSLSNILMPFLFCYFIGVVSLVFQDRLVTFFNGYSLFWGRIRAFTHCARSVLLTQYRLY